MRSILLAGAMMLASTAVLGAPAQQAAAPAAAAPANKTLDPNERVCKDVFSGSRIAPKLVCATRAQWQDREREDQDATKLMQRPFQMCPVMAMRSC